MPLPQAASVKTSSSAKRIFTVWWLFFRPAGRKNNHQKKKSTLLPQAKAALCISSMLFNSYLQRYSHNLLLMPELAPYLVATRLRERVYKADIGAIGDTGGQYAAGRH